MTPLYRISKEIHFSASHVLSGLPEGHPCGRLHGHNYVVRVTLAARSLHPADRVPGFVLDYRELEAVKVYIDQHLDHRHLNDWLTELADTRFPSPSAEILAEALFHTTMTLLHVAAFDDNESVVWLDSVEVSETPKTWAWYGYR